MQITFPLTALFSSLHCVSSRPKPDAARVSKFVCKAAGEQRVETARPEVHPAFDDRASGRAANDHSGQQRTNVDALARLISADRRLGLGIAWNSGAGNPLVFFS